MNNRLILSFKMFLLFVFLSIPIGAIAAGVPPSVIIDNAEAADIGAAMGLTGNANFSDNLSASISNVVNAIEKVSKGYAESIFPMANTLLASLAVIAVAWAGMNLAMTSGSLSEPMNKLITTIFTVGFATWLISGSGYTTLTGGIDSLMTDLVSKVPGGSTIDKMFQAFMESQFNALGQVIEAFSAWDMWTLITQGGVTVLLCIVLFIAMLVTSVVGMIAALTSLVMVAIAMAVGPIFIPFLVLQKTSFLFDGWLKFLINACLTKVIIALLLAIGSAAMAAAATTVSGGALDAGGMIGSLLASLAVSGVVMSLMLTAPGIAGAITSGGAISQDGFAGRMHSAAKTMGRNSSVKSTQGVGNIMQKVGAKIGGKTGGALSSAAERLRSSNSGGRVDGLKPSTKP